MIEPEGEPKKILRVTLPLGMQLLHGTRIIIDSNPPQQSPYVICFANGCMSDYEVTPGNDRQHEEGPEPRGAGDQRQRRAADPAAAAGSEFAKAYDGPPTDPKVFEEKQKKLQEELQKRAEEARKKLEANRPARQRRPIRRRSKQRFDETKKAPQSGAFFVCGGERQRQRPALVQRGIARAIAARLVLHENLGDLRMPDRLAGIVGQQILLRDIGDVFGFGILGEQMIERLILVRPDFFRDRQPPFLGIVEYRIDVENHAPERKDPVADDLADLEFGGTRFDHILSNRP